jgi:hypothetical protein
MRRDRALVDSFGLRPRSRARRRHDRQGYRIVTALAQ